jgi:type VI protein secretion system component VasK
VIWVIVVAVVVVVALAVGAWIVTRRRRPSEPGVASFQRHIDALSPEARREVADRVKRQRDDSGETDRG